MADDSSPLRPRTSNMPQAAISPSPVASTDGPTALLKGVKGHIKDPTENREFTKLANSFTQGYITSEVFVDKAASFIGGDRKLMEDLKKFVAMEGSYERADDGKENRWVSEPPPLEGSPAALTDESTIEETALFAGVKNFTGSIGIYNEFIKLFRSFVQGETTKGVVVDKFKSLLGRDIKLMGDLKKLLVHLEGINEQAATENFTGDSGIYNKLLRLFNSFVQGETTAEILVNEFTSLVGRDIKLMDYLEKLLVRLEESYEQTDTAKENFQTFRRPPQDKAKKPSAIVLTDGPTDAETALFVGARNFIGDNETFNEFLKLFRSFAQGEIATDVLLDKAANFIGSDRGLMYELKRFVGWEGSYERVRNAVVNGPKQRPPRTITFQMVPTTGLSYRLLEKLAATQKCSGRDELCDEVLNDMWGSNHKLASKGSSFYHPDKNKYEEKLFDVEEERFEYDFKIKTCGDAIGWLESLSEGIIDMHMTAREKEEYRITQGFTGNISVFKQVLRTVYGEELGLGMFDLVNKHPVATIPQVLTRLKEQELEWKREKQEKQEQWRERNANAYLKSLDHRGLHIKEADRKLFAIKTFVEEIRPKQKEWETKPKKLTLKYSFEDFGIVLDACRLMVTALEHGRFSDHDRDKIAGFINVFIPLFFGMPSKDVEDVVNAAMQKPPVGAGFSYDLLRDVLKQGNNEFGVWIPRPMKHIPVGSQNRRSLADEPMQRKVYPLYCNTSIYGLFRALQILYSRLSEFKSREEEPVIFENLYPRKGHKVAEESNVRGSGPGEDSFIRNFTPQESNLRGLDPDEELSYTEESHIRGIRSEELMNAWGIPMDIDEESNVRGMDFDNFNPQELVNPIPSWSLDEERSIRHLKLEDEVKALRLNDEDIPTTKLPKSNTYSQVLELCENFIKGKITSDEFEDNLRKVSLMKGYLLYTIGKLLELNLRLIQGIVPSDSGKIHPHKAKSVKILLMYQRDRERRELTERDEEQDLLAYQKRVGGTLGMKDLLFKIEWHEPNKKATVCLVAKGDIPDVPDMDADEKLNSYIDSYMMSSPTEGIPLHHCRKVFLRRNLPHEKDVLEASASNDGACFESEPMRIGFEAQSYRIVFEGAWDCLVQSRAFRTVKGSKELNRSKELRQKRWNREVLGKAPWMEGLSDAEKRKKLEAWENFVTGNHLTALG
ncbi:Transcriptional regulatory protein sin3 [Rhizina undulata]